MSDDKDCNLLPHDAGGTTLKKRCPFSTEAFDDIKTKFQYIVNAQSCTSFTKDAENLGYSNLQQSRNIFELLESLKFASSTYIQFLHQPKKEQYSGIVYASDNHKLTKLLVELELGFASGQQIQSGLSGKLLKTTYPLNVASQSNGLYKSETPELEEDVNFIINVILRAFSQNKTYIEAESQLVREETSSLKLLVIMMFHVSYSYILDEFNLNLGISLRLCSLQSLSMLKADFHARISGHYGHMYSISTTFKRLQYCDITTPSLKISETSCCILFKTCRVVSRATQLFTAIKNKNTHEDQINEMSTDFVGDRLIHLREKESSMLSKLVPRLVCDLSQLIDALGYILVTNELAGIWEMEPAQDSLSSLKDKMYLDQTLNLFREKMAII